jgi:hypothetical protein
MESALMNYRFTAIIIILLCSLAFFVEPAWPRNEYLNDGTNTCSTGSFDISVEQRASEYYHRPYDPANAYSNPSDDQSIRLTWRKYLGSACTKEFREVQTENAQLKQQLELMKMCGKVNNNPTIARNPNFALLVQKCSGIVIPENKKPEGSHWDDLKDQYKKKNPEIKLMGDKFIGPNEQ